MFRCIKDWHWINFQYVNGDVSPIVEPPIAQTVVFRGASSVSTMCLISQNWKNCYVLSARGCETNQEMYSLDHWELFISISYASCILDIHGMIPGNEHTFIVRSEHDQSSVSRISIQNYWGVINPIRFLLNTPMVYSQIYVLRWGGRRKSFIVLIF